tara:strand:+ start:5749 stop:6105 length:357 start_codon:yes stop_codon:yes gene_type:complete
MKKSFLCFLSISLSFFAFSQDYSKFQMQRATMFSSYIAEQMELSETEQKFVYDVMLARVYNSNSKIKSENLTEMEDKRAVYSAEYKIAQQKLADEFGAKNARKMMSLSNEARKKTDKN